MSNASYMYTVLFRKTFSLTLNLIIFSYHIKYKHIGDLKKEEIEKVVTSLHPQLRMRLRFLVHSLNASQGNFDQHSAAITPTSLPTTSTGGIMPSTSESMDLS